MGGHGTVPGEIFAFSEAETMARRLIELGIPADIIVTETKATNSALNIQYTDKLMQAEKYHFNNILISGSPAALLRQMRTFEKQSKYKWAMLVTAPPHFTQIQQEYYFTSLNAYINFFYALREIASFLDYTVNTGYMSSRCVSNPKQMQAAIEIMIKYYNLLTGKQTKKSELSIFIDSINKFITKKNLNSSYSDQILSNQVIEISNYFRAAFSLIECQYMRKLTKLKNVIEQSALLTVSARSYGIFGLDPARQNIKLKQKDGASPHLAHILCKS